MIKKYKILCENCGEIITDVTIYPDGESKDNLHPLLKLSGLNWLCSSNVYKFTKNTLLQIGKLIEENRHREIGKLPEMRLDMHDLFGFFCRDCGKNYCINCWTNLEQVFEGDFYDYTLATCPIGHKHEIND